MTQFVYPFRESPLTAPEVLEWLRGQRAGIISGLEVSAGSGSWDININSGRIRTLDGSQIYDDATKIDLSGIINRDGGLPDEHFTIWATYVYSDTTPAATMTYTSQKSSPPTVPSQPVNSIRLCDIFIPAGANAITDANIVFVNAAKIPPIGDGGDPLLDYIAKAAESLKVVNENGFSLNDATGDVSWAGDITINSLVHSHAQRFTAAPVARAVIPDAQSPLNIGGSPGSHDAIIYAEIDRTSPTDLGAVPTVTIKAVDLTNTTPPGDPNLADFQDPTKIYNIVILGYVQGATLFMNVSGGGLPPPNGNVGEALIENPGGTLAFQDMLDEWMIGGHRVVPWSDGTYADEPTALAALIDATRLKNGMVVRARETNADLVNEWEYDGANWNQYRPTNAPVSATLGVGVVSGCTVSSPAGTTEVVIAPGKFVDPSGRVVEVRNAVTVDITGADQTWIVRWDDDQEQFSAQTMSGGLANLDLPFAVVVKSGGALTKLIDVRRRAVPSHDSMEYLIVDDFATSGNHSTLYHALLHSNCYSVRRPKDIRVGDVVMDLEHNNVGGLDTGFFPGTVTVGTLASGLDKVDGVGTRFRVHYQAGDYIIIAGTAVEILTVDSDTLMTLTANWPAADQNGVAYDRVTCAGPSRLMFDLNQPEWTSAQFRLHNMTIRGGNATDAEGNGRFEWGEFTFPGVGQTGAPLFDFGAQLVKSWRFEDIMFAYEGADDDTQDDICIWKNLPRSTVVKNCDLSGGSDLSHIAYWTGTVQLGGEQNDNSSATLFDNVNIVDAVDINAVGMFFFENSLNSDGSLVFRHCNVESSTADYFIDIDDTDASTADFSVEIDTCDIDGFGVAFMRHNNDANTASRSNTLQTKHIIGGTLRPSGTPQLMDQPGNGIDCTGVRFVSSMNLTGGGLITACRSQNTITIPPEVKCVNCDFGGIGAQVNDQVIPLLDPIMVEVIGGLRQSHALDGTRKSRVLYGCELFPDIQLDGGPANFDTAPQLVCKPGALLMPNGQVTVFASDLVANTAGGAGLGTPLNDIDDTPIAVGPGVLYAFVRYSTLVSGGDTATLYFSVNKGPDAYGRPHTIGASHSGAGYTVSDFAYVGMLPYRDRYALQASPSDENTDGMARIWGAAQPIHFGTGMRRIGLARPDGLGPWETNFDWGDPGATGRYTATMVSAAQHSVLGTGIYAHAKAYGMHTSLYIQAPAFAADGRIIAHGMNQFLWLLANDLVTYNLDWEAPIQPSTIDITLELDTLGGGNLAIVGRNNVVYVVEDVNNIGPAPVVSGYPGSLLA